MSTISLTVAQAGLLSCETCALLSRPADPAEPGYCPRCGEELAWRRHHSIQYTWALVIAAAICFIPANLIPVQRGSPASSRERTRLYRMVEFIGRWSMLDVFVDTFTVALIQLQPLMFVEPGPGVVFFAAVVVLTMIAAESFDPRLIWDSLANREG